MRFEVLGAILNREVIAEGEGLRLYERLVKTYGEGAWCAMKGAARVRLSNGSVHVVELHWYEAQGTGERELKIKRYLGEP